MNFKQLLERAGFHNYTTAGAAIGCSDTLLSALARGIYHKVPRAIFIKGMATVFKVSENQIRDAIRESIRECKMDEAKAEFNKAIKNHAGSAEPTTSAIISELQEQVTFILGRLTEVETKLRQVQDREAKRREGVLPS